MSFISKMNITNVVALVGLILFSGFQAVSATEATSEENPPNIVLFMADDLGAADIGPYGNVVVRTPNLDRLAGQSLLFSEAFAASPTCSPSRAALHTGMMPFRNGAHANHTGINEGIKTLPAYFRQLGYKVGIAGKYHIGPREAYPFELIHGTNVPEPGHEEDGVLWTDLKMNPVDEWISKASEGDKPFMLVVNDHSPHVRWPEQPTYDPAKVDIPSRHIDTPSTRHARARYYTDITKMDRNVGQLLESLEKYEIDDNTVVIFTADQGPQWAFGKWNLYDYGMRVPLLIKWSGQIKGGTQTDALVSLADILPTLVELAGGIAPSAPEQIDGRSFLPVLLGEKSAHRERVFGSHTGDGTMNRIPMRMLRTHRYKYILNLAPEVRYTTHMDQVRKNGYWDSWVEQSFQHEHAASILWRYHRRPAEELYDLRFDPGEQHNLAGDPHYAELLESFRRQMKQWRNQQGDNEKGPYKAPKKKHGKPVAPYIFK